MPNDHVAEVIDSDRDRDDADFVMSDPDFLNDVEERPGDCSFFRKKRSAPAT